MNEVVPLEVAESEFERFGDTHDLDFNCDAWQNEEKVSGFLENKEKIVKAIMNGSLVVSEEGLPVFTPRKSGATSSLTFNEPTGATWQSMDKAGKNTGEVAKLMTIMAQLTRTDVSTFSNMKNTDLKVCMAVTALFLAQ